MRIFILVFLLLGSAIAQAGELEQAYQKEFAYLVAEKKALEQRLANLKVSQESQLNKVSGEIDALQKTFLSKQNLTDRLNHQMAEASRNADFSENDDLLMDTTFGQAKESLSKLGKSVDESSERAQRLEQLFAMASDVLVNDGQVKTEDGQFYLMDGEAVDGKIVDVGRVAKYGVGPQGGGVLAPAGAGQFKVWDGQTRSTADQLIDNLAPANIDVFLYDNAEKGMEKQDEKSFEDDVRAGGMVGEVIIALGVAGLLLIGLRIVMLSRAGSNLTKLAAKVNDKVSNGDVAGALESCKKQASAASKVIAATLRNLDRDRDHIEDVISETILHESSRIDRFGSAILVIAAISPLLGLLGTVTGMISTFDIITEFGTGDPKLLSSGISEALLTTKFGLVVAIPMLLVGNLLSSWAKQIKNDLEQAALHMINTHKV